MGPNILFLFVCMGPNFFKLGGYLANGGGKTEKDLPIGSGQITALQIDLSWDWL